MYYFISLFFLVAAILFNHAALALFLGILFSLIFNPLDNFISKKIGSLLLQVGIVILGGSISVASVAETTSSFFVWISIFVIVTFFAGIYLGKLLRVSNTQSYLLASGTAICGATAMAAIAPILKAKPRDYNVVITIVFVLNAIAVVIFPIAAINIGLTERQFGFWSALAIHDTSSVLGSASMIGDKAMEVATTLKMGRTVWIVPLVVFSAWYYSGKRNNFGLPIFVIFFAFAIFLNYLINPSEETETFLREINKIFLLSGLFCIGTQSDRSIFKDLNAKPLFLAVGLWVVIVPLSLLLVISLI